MAEKNSNVTKAKDETAKYHLYSNGNVYWGMNVRIGGEFGVKIEKTDLQKENVPLTVDELKELYVKLNSKKEEEHKKIQAKLDEEAKQKK